MPNKKLTDLGDIGGALSSDDLLLAVDMAGPTSKTASVGAVADFTIARDAELAAIAALTSAANTVPYFTGSGAASLATLTAAARTFLAAVDASAQRTALGLGTVATTAASAYATSTQGTKADNAAAKANNLSDLASTSTARTNLGLGTAATTAATAYATALQGVIVCTSGTRPGSPVEGQVIYETNLDRVKVYTGATWRTAYGLMGCAVSRSSNMTLTNGATTDLTWPTEGYDADAGFTPGGAAYTVPEDGTYGVTVRLSGTGFTGGFGSYIEIVAATIVYAFPLLYVSPAVASMVVSISSGLTVYARVVNATGANITDAQGAFDVRFLGR